VELVRQSATTFGTRILIALVNLPISMLVARTLGADGQGVYAAAIALPTLWATFWLFGIDAAHSWSLASGRTSLGRVLGNTVLWIVMLSVVATPSYLLVSRFLNPEKVERLLPVLGITAILVPLFMTRQMLLACFQGLRRIDQYNILMLVSQILLLAALALVLHVLEAEERGAVWALVGASTLLLILAGVWIYRHKKPDDPMRTDRTLMKSSLSYGIRGYGTVVCGQITYRFDQALVPHFVGMAEQGYYSIAVLLAEKLTHITNTLQIVLFPKISASTPEEANRITATAVRHALFWVGAAAIGLYLLGRRLIVLLYTSEFEDALGPFTYLLVAIFLLTFSKILTIDLSGRNRRFPCTVAMLIAMIVNLVLNLLWIPKYKMMGAAYASAIAYGVQSAVMILFFVRITGVPFRKLIIPERGDIEIYRRILQRLLERVRRP
jgi:O-antigen/teichoic acid export membrane protein